MSKASDDIDPQLPYIQIHRGVAAKAALLAAKCKADYLRVRGALDCFWESLADRRVLNEALAGPGFVAVTRAKVMEDLCEHIGCTPEQLVAAGFLEPLEDPEGVWTYRVRGMSRYINTEKARVGRKTEPEPGGRDADATRSTPARDPDGVRSPPASRPLDTRSPPAPDPTEVRGERREVKGERAAFIEQLEQDFFDIVKQKYLFSKADGVQLAALERDATREEIRLRWRRGLKVPNGKWPSCRSIASLASGKLWNALAEEPGGPPALARPSDADVVGHGPIVATIMPRGQL